MLIEELRAELAGLSEQLERKKKVDAMIESLQQKEQELTLRVLALGEALAKENADVERLEKTTVTSLLYSLLGKIDQKMSQEQQEAFAAKLKYDAAGRQLDDCKAQLDVLRRERGSYASVAGQYEHVYASLLQQLRDDPAHAERLCSLEQRHGAIVRQIKELDEAISAGCAAQSQAKIVLGKLDSAENWGTWDMLGGGFLADMAKHSKLDEAQDGAEELQLLLTRFHTELADVAVNPSFGPVNVDGFLRFADFFFDGFFADWSVQSRIHDSQNGIHEVWQQIGNALERLYVMKSASVKEKDSIDQSIRELASRG